MARRSFKRDSAPAKKDSGSIEIVTDGTFTVALNSSVIRRIPLLVEVVILAALILATRCANYQNVFIAGNVYFTDADCYARMTRVRICAEHPGKIIRRHDFENFPQGTVPHTTAPLDYLILLLSWLLQPLTTHAIDLAGAVISPLLALFAGWFLWWWSRSMKLRYRWAMLLLFALSPILVHGIELGRPDHQSLLMLLLVLAICAEWKLRTTASRRWSLTSGFAWGMALWVSLYEPLILLLVLFIFYAICDRRQLTGQPRRIGWVALGVIFALSLLIERRISRFPISTNDPILTNWSRTIGELMPVRFTDPIWFQWCGLFLIATPLLLWIAVRKEHRSDGATGPPARENFRSRALPIFALLVACYALTLWQARWGYFFAMLFVIALPLLLEQMKSRCFGWLLFVVSLFPILQDWDGRLWPNESESTRRMEARLEAAEWRDLATQIRSRRAEPFLAPWWLSPSIAYWSGQPGVAGSSHESLPGIAETARFCLTNDAETASEILRSHHVAWVFAYNSDRVLQNSAALLNVSIAGEALGKILDRTPGRAPKFLRLQAQNDFGKLYRVNYFP
jgi:hypothetical protein